MGMVGQSLDRCLVFHKLSLSGMNGTLPWSLHIDDPNHSKWLLYPFKNYARGLLGCID